MITSYCLQMVLTNGVSWLNSNIVKFGVFNTSGQEVLRKNVMNVSVSNYIVTTTCLLEESEANTMLAEIALYDNNNNMLCKKSFTPLDKKNSMRVWFTYEIRVVGEAV